eukprot:scaffold57515_cov18-Prasinocladus_malaysianus.AAC.4
MCSSVIVSAIHRRVRSAASAIYPAHQDGRDDVLFVVTRCCRLINLSTCYPNLFLPGATRYMSYPATGDRNMLVLYAQ